MIKKMLFKERIINLNPRNLTLKKPWKGHKNLLIKNKNNQTNWKKRKKKNQEAKRNLKMNNSKNFKNTNLIKIRKMIRMKKKITKINRKKTRLSKYTLQLIKTQK